MKKKNLLIPADFLKVTSAVMEEFLKATSTNVNPLHVGLGQLAQHFFKAKILNKLLGVKIWKSLPQKMLYLYLLFQVKPLKMQF
jgi:hypothetical protein